MEKEKYNKQLLFAAGFILVLIFLAPTAGCIILGALVLFYLFDKRPRNDRDSDNRNNGQ